jgi:hypothetical protein
VPQLPAGPQAPAPQPSAPQQPSGPQTAAAPGPAAPSHSPGSTEADWDLDEDAEDESWDVDQENHSEEVKAIDATLARFSAVHDQIAQEEADRRKKYSWLLGQRKQPELGEDMPFDFIEGRDAQASRLEWKRQQRKRRIQRIFFVVAIVVVVVGGAVLALRMLA